MDHRIEELKSWRVQSPEEPGFHTVITPETGSCRELHVFRLNLSTGESWSLESGELEMNAALIQGKAQLKGLQELEGIVMEQYDAFYIPGRTCVRIEAQEDCVFYIAGAIFENIGKAMFRKFDTSQPLGQIHQIHGSGAGEREVLFTVAPSDEASRLICGLTWGRMGGWTSWPPHQHEKDLEEVYCYFNIPAPKFGYHISYLNSGEIEDGVVHKVQSGTMVQAPRGYHPTVGSPAVKNAYFWALAAFSHEQRRYDLAVEDPAYQD